MDSELKIYKLNNDTFRGHKYPNGVYIEGLKIKPISYCVDFSSNRKEDVYKFNLLNYGDKESTVDYRIHTGNTTVFKDLLSKIYRETGFVFKEEKSENKYDNLDHFTVNAIVTNKAEDGSVDIKDIKRIIKYKVHYID